MTNYRKGSMGAAEQKQNRLIGVAFGIITILILLVQFVIPSQYRTEVIDAPTWMNWVGGLITAGSIVPVILEMTTPDEGKPYSWAWLIMIGLGFFIAAGFFDNPHSYLNN